MPKALVSMAILQIAPGTIRHGVRLHDDDLPRSGYPGRFADLSSAALTSARAQTSLQFLRSESSSAGKPDVGNAQQGAPATSD